MKRHKNLICYTLASFLMMLATSIPALAQGNLKVTGVVKDEEGLPVTGVTVMVPGTQNVVVTGFDGVYSITVKKGETLV